MATASRGRVLLVDSDARDVGAQARTLGEAGFDVKAASSTQDAGSLLENERFDVVLCDLAMPDMDVSAFLRVIRRFDPNIPVVLMTTADLRVPRSVVREVDRLSKPISPPVLERTLDRAVLRIRRRRSITAYRNGRGEEVEVASFSASAAKNEFGQVLQKAADGLVVITRHDEPQAVLLSFDEFHDLVSARENKLETLTNEFGALLARMQTPQARRGMKAAFDATPARMGKAAVAAAGKRD